MRPFKDTKTSFYYCVFPLVLMGAVWFLFQSLVDFNVLNFTFAFVCWFFVGLLAGWLWREDK